jgi:ATP-binding cassette subfamily B multidrug efflux pump
MSVSKSKPNWPQEKGDRMNTMKRLFDYALLYKKTILIALLMLSIAVAAELMGPLIAKRMIDKHILGIEMSWYKTAQGPDAVEYKGSWYKRSDRFEAGEAKGPEVRILQAGREFYFLDQPLEVDGKRSVADGIMTVSRGEKSVNYEVERLTVEELMAFYRPEFKPFMQLIGLYFVLLLIAGIFQYGQRFLLQTSSNRVIQKMRMDVFGQIHRLPIQYFDNRPAGKIVSRVTNDTEAIRELYVNVLANFFTGVIYITGIFVAMFFLDAELAALCLVLLPILWVWIVGYRKFASKYNHIVRSRLSDINGMINESIQGMTIIRAFRRQKETNKEFEVLNEEHFTYQNKLLSLNALTSHNLVGILRNLAFVALIWYFGGASIGIGSVVTVGVLYAFVDYLNRLFHPVQGIVNQLANLEQARVASERVFELMDLKGTDVAAGHMARYKGHVIFDHVTFAYKDEEYVLRDISFEAKPGETVALVGHTGSGKSSIMNLLFRFYDVQQGSIYIDGHNIRDLPKQYIRQHMGIVLQDPFLFTGTIASNVSLDDPSITKEQVDQALRDVGAERIFRHLPKGFDEPVIEKGSTLSAGQRQLISFARALAFNPAVLILDEATASIDTETEAVIQDALEVLKRGRTTFIIAHRLSTIKKADQILVLDRGAIVERGSHEALMKNRGRYYQMYQLQQGQDEKGVDETEGATA